VLAQCWQKISGVFQLSDENGILATDSSLQRLLQAIFDSQVQGFLQPDSHALFSQLESSTKARIFAQAIAGFLIVARRLTAFGEATVEVFNREVQLFTESEQRAAMLATIEQSDLFSHCYMADQISHLILDAIDPKEGKLGATTEETEHMLTWATELEVHRNMGLPWGFSFIPVN